MASTEEPPHAVLSRVVRASYAAHTRIFAVLAASAIVVAAILVPASAAQAAPSAAEIKKEIAQLNNQIEIIVEQYNGVHAKLADDKAKSAALQLQLGPAQLQAAIAQARLGSIANDIYMTGPATTLEALLSTSSTNNLVDEMGALDEIARQQRASITSAAELVNRYQTQKSALDALIAKEKVQDAQLAAKKKQILAQLAKLTKLQQAAGGSSGSTSKFTKAYVMPVACPFTSSTGAGHTAAVKACSLLWPIHMYGWAEAGPSRYDCSGLTMTAWAAAGVTLTHHAATQWTETTRVSKSNLRPGDLVFYYKDHHHVAIYIGGGWIVQASETGQPVKESKMGSPSGYGRP